MCCEQNTGNWLRPSSLASSGKRVASKLHVGHSTKPVVTCLLTSKVAFVKASYLNGH